MASRDKIVYIEGEHLRKELKRFIRSYRLHIMSRYMHAGAALAILILLSVYIYKIRVPSFQIPFWTFALPIFFAIILSILKPINLHEIVSDIDRKLGLKERLLTSIYFLESTSAYAPFLLSDSLKHLQTAHPELLYPVKWMRFIVLCAALILGIFFFSYHNLSFVKAVHTLDISENLNSVIMDQGAQIDRFADELKRNSSIGNQDENILIQKLELLGNELESGTVSKRNALLMLSDLSSFVRKRFDNKEADLHSYSADHTESPKVNLPSRERNTALDILNLLARAKRNIAQAGFSPTGESRKNSNGRILDSTAYSQQETLSEAAGVPDNRSSGKVDSSAGVSSSPAQTIPDQGYKNDAMTYKKDTSGYLIQRYSDSAIPIESVPQTYHNTIKKYFDAISGEK